MKTEGPTTIRLSRTARNGLEKIGKYGETADDILIKLLDLWDACEDPVAAIDVYRKKIAIQKSKIQEPSIFDSGEKV